MTFIFKNRTIFWDIPKWNRGQTKQDGQSTNKIIGTNKETNTKKIKGTSKENIKQ